MLIRVDWSTAPPCWVDSVLVVSKVAGVGPVSYHPHPIGLFGLPVGPGERQKGGARVLGFVVDHFLLDGQERVSRQHGEVDVVRHVFQEEGDRPVSFRREALLGPEDVVDDLRGVGVEPTDI